MTKTPRVNKKRAEIAAEAVLKADVERQKVLVRSLWPFIQDDALAIYDGQTIANAVAGYIKYELEVRLSQLKVSDLIIDLKNEKDGPIKSAMLHLLEVFKDENAKSSADLLERFGKTLGMYSAHAYMKQPMKTLSVDEIVA